MSFSVDQLFTTDWGNIIYRLSQQDGSRLRACVDVLPNVTGEDFTRPRIGAAKAIRKESRHGDTPLLGLEHSKRWGTLAMWHWSDLIDMQDRINMGNLMDPANSYTRSAIDELGRAIDVEIIDAMTGKARTGSDGRGEDSLPTSQTIAKGTSDAAKMTVAKLRNAAQKMNAAEVPKVNRYIAVSAQQLEDLLSSTEVTSSDYNMVKTLVNGQVDTFLGFKFIHTELLPKADGTRKSIAWQRDGICLGIGSEITSRMDERPDKAYSLQVYASIMCGAVRLEENRVVVIESKES